MGRYTGIRGEGQMETMGAFGLRGSEQPSYSSLQHGQRPDSLVPSPQGMQTLSPLSSLPPDASRPAGASRALSPGDTAASQASSIA